MQAVSLLRPAGRYARAAGKPAAEPLGLPAGNLLLATGCGPVFRPGFQVYPAFKENYGRTPGYCIFAPTNLLALTGW